MTEAAQRVASRYRLAARASHKAPDVDAIEGYLFDDWTEQTNPVDAIRRLGLAGLFPVEARKLLRAWEQERPDRMAGRTGWNASRALIEKVLGMRLA